MTIRKAPERFKVPKSILIEKIKLLKQGKEIELKPVMRRFKKTFPEEYELLLEDIATDKANDGAPMSKKEFLMMAYDIAKKQKKAVWCRGTPDRNEVVTIE
ncbi:unnamed protein product [Arctia plantaginis]|uniref:Uncharacterized protein n=1 Tax=Arctia plantaginis TaxID=874455 RepID=A0A8S0YMS1_ARCPL|nr:unnamed protein product [Arctia plantaginis]